ncbi:hypothetical protein H5410_064209 [Solanum commersonii]|uniref:Uncharacterized protein n=1 Tax=Solanum commersonii TaxID=4109 RepID=A0A9J5W075_SOLCO|nr:hypothetical protein H5410_064209 [Solanum commersonii]
MYTLFIQRSSRWKLALKLIAFKSHLFGGEGCAPYLFNVQEVKDVHPIYSTFKLVETCVERYLHLSHIYSEVNDVHPIYSTFNSNRIYSEVNDVHLIYSHSSRWKLALKDICI